MKATSNNYKTDINCSVDCSTNNIIYFLGCKGRWREHLRIDSQNIEDMLIQTIKQRQQQRAQCEQHANHSDRKGP